jgi:hypothetical protein
MALGARGRNRCRDSPLRGALNRMALENIRRRIESLFAADGASHALFEGSCFHWRGPSIIYFF